MTAPSKPQVEAYDAGRQALADGKPVAAVLGLYPRGEFRTLWIRGWVQARAEARYGPRP